MATGDSIFQESVFADGEGWTIFHRGERMAQRYRLDGKRMYTESRCRVAAPAEAVVEKFRGPWTWWQNGRYERRRELSGGEIEYHLWPAAVGIEVRETMHPPLTLEDGTYRLRIDLELDCTGVAYIDARPIDEASSEIVGRFAGVEVTGLMSRLMFGTRGFALNHLRAERGALWWRPGTGWPGLLRELEGTA